MFISFVFCLFLLLRRVYSSNITFYIDSESSINCSSNCNGSEASPFPDLFYALHFVETQPMPDLITVFMKNKNYLLTDDSIQPYLSAMNLTYYWPIFQNMANKTITLNSILNKSNIW